MTSQSSTLVTTPIQFSCITESNRERLAAARYMDLRVKDILRIRTHDKRSIVLLILKIEDVHDASSPGHIDIDVYNSSDEQMRTCSRFGKNIAAFSDFDSASVSLIRGGKRQYIYHVPKIPDYNHFGAIANIAPTCIMSTT